MPETMNKIEIACDAIEKLQEVELVLTAMALEADDAGETGILINFKIDMATVSRAIKQIDEMNADPGVTMRRTAMQLHYQQAREILVGSN